jgi:hypothetical protein
MPDSGSSAFQNWFPGVSNDTVFATVVTISIFVLGYLFNRLYDTRVQKRRQDDIREFVLSSLEAILPAIERQVGAFGNLKQQITSKQHQDYIFTESTSLNFEGLDSVPRSEVFHTFARGRKKHRAERIKHFNALWGAIDFICQQKEIARQMFLQFNEKYYRYLLIWNENVDSIVRLHDEYLMVAKQTQVRPSEDTFFKEFNIIIHRLAQTGDPSSWEKEKINLLDPLLETCNANLEDARAIIVMKKIIQAQYAYYNREHLLESFGSYFEEQMTGLVEKKKTILEGIQFYRGIAENA